MFQSSIEYNTLPPGATIAVADDGETITLTASAREEPGEALRRRCLTQSAIEALVYGTGVLLLIGALSYGFVRQQWPFLPWWTPALFGVFVLALFALLWQSAYRKKVDAVLGPLRQSTVIAVRPQRLLVESSGPLGESSLDLTRTQIRDIKLLLALRENEESKTDAIAIFTHDGQLIRILPARDPEELRWVAKLLRRTLRIEPADAV